MMVDYFIGVWILDSDQSDYQVGEPPKTGKYTIEAEAYVNKFYKVILQNLNVRYDDIPTLKIILPQHI